MGSRYDDIPEPPEREPDEPRYGAALFEDFEGRWSAGVFLYEDEYCAKIGHDFKMETWCGHRHKTQEAAERCLPKMEATAKALNGVTYEFRKRQGRSGSLEQG